MTYYHVHNIKTFTLSRNSLSKALSLQLSMSLSIIICLSRKCFIKNVNRILENYFLYVNCYWNVCSKLSWPTSFFKLEVGRMYRVQICEISTVHFSRYFTAPFAQILAVNQSNPLKRGLSFFCAKYRVSRFLTSVPPRSK